MEAWVLTREINEYNQEGEYFERLFFEKPTAKELSDIVGMTESYCEEFIIGGKGRDYPEDVWYNLYKFDKKMGIFSSSKSTITVNGKTYQGNNVKISNNKVYIDGVLQDTEDQKRINITVNGNIDKLQVDACNEVFVTGDVSTLKTMYGDVEIGGSVSGSIKTMSGDVNCGTVGGDISTMSGDVKHRK